MKIGISMPHSGFLTERKNISLIASKSDVLGFDFLTVSDHIIIPKYVDSKMPYAVDGTFNPGDGFCYDPLTLLSFLSAVTEKIRLVPSVMVVPYRNPMYAAKMISTIDVLSSGRITVGCGVGWLKEEFEVLGAHDFHSRGIVTNEYIESMIELWTQSDPTYKGKYIEFQNILFAPKPIQDPHPPIWIGGESEAAIKRAARIGNGWFPLSQNPTFPLKTNEQLNLSLGHLKKELDLRNKNINEFDVVFQPGWANLSEYNIDMLNDNSSQITENILELERLGVTHVLFYFPKIELTALHDVLDNFADGVLKQLS